MSGLKKKKKAGKGVANFRDSEKLRGVCFSGIGLLIHKHRKMLVSGWHGIIK